MAKKQAKVQSGGKDNQVKYSDPRMAYMSTKSELVVKESETVKMRDIFGGVLGANSPVVVCEDQNGLYVTSKANVDVPLLDGYRMYRRNEYDITRDEDSFKVVKDGREIVI